MKIGEYEQMMSWLTRPESPKTETREDFAIGSQPENIQPMTGLIDNVEQPIEDTTTGPGGYPMTAGLTNLPMKVPAAVKAIESGAVTLSKGKKLVSDFLKQRNIYPGATKKDYTPEKNFLEVFETFANKHFGGNISKTSENLNLPRQFVKGIKDRVALSETGVRSSAGFGKDFSIAKATVPEPKNGLSFNDVTTNMKKNPESFYNLIKRDPETNRLKNEYLDAESLGHYLGMSFERNEKGIRKGSGKILYDAFGNVLRDPKTNIKFKTTLEGKKIYNVNDAINKLLTRSENKLVKGDRKSDRGLGRYKVERDFDPELDSVRNGLKQRTRTRSQDLDIYMPYAIDDVGHPFSLIKSEQNKAYKKLFKDSNINRLNTLVYQDPLINSQLFKNSGYETKYESIFNDLTKIQNKTVTKEVQKQLLDVKKRLNDNYNYIQDIINDPKKISQYINKNTVLADKKYLNYLSTQGDRVQKIDINIPKVGSKFKSEDVFADMSVVNPKYIMGYVNQINPNAKKFKDLSMSEQALFKANALEQSSKIVSDFYKKAKFSKDDVETVAEGITMDYATGGRVGLKEGTPKKPIFSKGAASQIARMSLLNPLGALTTAYTLDGTDALDPRKTEGRLTLGAEATFAKDLVRGSQNLVRGSNLSIQKQRAVQKLLNLGLSPKMAIRAARIASPIGIATLLGEGVYQGGKYMLERKKLLESLTDEQKDELLSKEKREAVMQNRRGDPEAFSGIMAANGGLISRQKFEDGSKDPKMNRRTFMKVMSGLASIPLLGKFIKPAAKVAESAAPVVADAPAHFWNLVAKIKTFGDDITQFGALAERQSVKKYKDLELTEDMATGQIEIQRVKVAEDMDYYGSPVTEESYMSYRPSQKILLDETNPEGGVRKTMPDYQEGTTYLRNDGPETGSVLDEMSGLSDDIFEEAGVPVPEAIRKK